jgi:hypothetical protein
MMEPEIKQPEEQLPYAEVMHWTTLAGFIVLIASFVAYVLNWLPAYVPLEQLPHLWSLPTAEYLKATGTPIGWSWLFMMGKGDFASLLGIAILSGSSIACIVAIIPTYIRDKNITYIAICVVEIAVLLISASGVFSNH